MASDFCSIPIRAWLYVCFQFNVRAACGGYSVPAWSGGPVLCVSRAPQGLVPMAEKEESLSSFWDYDLQPRLEPPPKRAKSSSCPVSMLQRDDEFRSEQETTLIG